MVAPQADLSRLFNKNGHGNVEKPSTSFVGNIIDVPRIVENIDPSVYQGLFNILGPLIASRLNRPSPFELFAEIGKTGLFDNIGKDDASPANNTPSQKRSSQQNEGSKFPSFSIRGKEGNDAFGLTTINNGDSLKIRGFGFDF